MTTSPQVDSAPTSYHIPPRRQREAALIVPNGDGFIELYGEQHVDFCIATKPYLESVEGEILAERFVEEMLTARFRDLYWPSKLRATVMVRKLRPSEIAVVEWRQEMTQTLDEIADRGREGRKIWIV